ncbi:hypothetical protein ABZZ20_36575, partial [Streptomyces sp. NPDC006430]
MSELLTVAVRLSDAEPVPRSPPPASRAPGPVTPGAPWPACSFALSVAGPVSAAPPVAGGDWTEKVVLIHVPDATA